MGASPLNPSPYLGVCPYLMIPRGGIEGVSELGPEHVQNDARQVWARTLGRLQETVQPKQFELWFRRIRAVAFEGR